MFPFDVDVGSIVPFGTHLGDVGQVDARIADTFVGQPLETIVSVLVWALPDESMTTTATQIF